jgi:uracil-DNA glycosylase
MTALSNRLDQNWRRIIGNDFDYAAMEEFLQKERAKRAIYPKDEEIFNALNLTPFEKVKVVIIGQDPYHGAGQANGLCFSVPKGIRNPPSLKNIYREIDDEYRPIKMPPHGDLTGWAAQGVLLLNATLTVEEGKAGSHQGKGWERFTDAIITAVDEKPDAVAFLLWGRRAQEKRGLISKRNKVLEASHPSGFSAHRGFLGCGHFRTANQYLEKRNLDPINWQNI